MFEYFFLAWVGLLILGIVCYWLLVNVFQDTPFSKKSWVFLCLAACVVACVSLLFHTQSNIKGAITWVLYGFPFPYYYEYYESMKQTHNASVSNMKNFELGFFVMDVCFYSNFVFMGMLLNRFRIIKKLHILL